MVAYCLKSALANPVVHPVSTSFRAHPFGRPDRVIVLDEFNAVAIWQDLVDQSSFTSAYESVKRYVRKLRGTRPPDPRAVAFGTLA